ncbi:hypothetical protein QBC39DRAFT_132714 [Podospora conica]|nr:hypothetical protein QBC39DRAFT_132714 [Schizothecium conicum]
MRRRDAISQEHRRVRVIFWCQHFWLPCAPHSCCSEGTRTTHTNQHHSPSRRYAAVVMQVKNVAVVEIEEFQIIMYKLSSWLVAQPCDILTTCKMASCHRKHIARNVTLGGHVQHCQTRCWIAKCNLHTAKHEPRIPELNVWIHNRRCSSQEGQPWPKPRVTGQADRDCIDLSSREETWKLESSLNARNEVCSSFMTGLRAILPRGRKDSLSGDIIRLRADFP